VGLLFKLYKESKHIIVSIMDGKTTGKRVVMWLRRPGKSDRFRGLQECYASVFFSHVQPVGGLKWARVVEPCRL